MALMTGEQYIESIKKINMQVYMFGKKIEDPTEDPILRPSLNSVRMTYDLAQMPEWARSVIDNQQRLLHNSFIPMTEELVLKIYQDLY